MKYRNTAATIDRIKKENAVSIGCRRIHDFGGEIFEESLACACCSILKRASFKGSGFERDVENGYVGM
jgi:hypothetical protein